jgi:hypothetical protein
MVKKFDIKTRKVENIDYSRYMAFPLRQEASIIDLLNDKSLQHLDYIYNMNLVTRYAKGKKHYVPANRV